jgi:hypothetical protein
MSAGGDTVTRAVIGLTALAFTAVLLYFSSSPALRCTRVDGRVDCEVTAKMLNRFAVDRARVAGVRSVAMVNGTIGTGRPKAFLNFRTDTGDVDLGYFSQRFGTSASDVDTFVRESAENELQLETGVTFRDITAYAAAGFLLLMGIAVLSSMSRKRSGRSVYDPPVN